MVDRRPAQRSLTRVGALDVDAPPFGFRCGARGREVAADATQGSGRPAVEERDRQVGGKALADTARIKGDPVGTVTVDRWGSTMIWSTAPMRCGPTGSTVDQVASILLAA